MSDDMFDDYNDSLMEDYPEGILDFEKDVEPKLREFLEANPNAKQEDVYDYFEEINHQLVIERLKTGKRQDERNEKKAA